VAVVSLNAGLATAVQEFNRLYRKPDYSHPKKSGHFTLASRMAAVEGGGCWVRGFFANAWAHATIASGRVRLTTDGGAKIAR
jgi:hypothetical protein